MKPTQVQATWHEILKQLEPEEIEEDSKGKQQAKRMRKENSSRMRRKIRRKKVHYEFWNEKEIAVEIKNRNTSYQTETREEQRKKKRERNKWERRLKKKPTIRPLEGKCGKIARENEKILARYKALSRNDFSIGARERINLYNSSIASYIEDTIW